MPILTRSLDYARPQRDGTFRCCDDKWEVIFLIDNSGAIDFDSDDVWQETMECPNANS